MSQASVLHADSARFAAGELTDAQVDAIFDSAVEDGWCFHDIDDAAMRAIFKRAASIGPVTAELSDPQLKALWEHAIEDGWCFHDFGYASLAAIFKRAATFVVPEQSTDATSTSTSTSTSTASVERFLEAVRQAIEPEIFEAGQCHTLAGVLQELFDGELIAIMRNQVTEEGKLFSTTYSHMFCEIDRLCYDIDGPDADSRWCEKWSDEPDEDGLTNKFEFLEIPAHDLMTFIDKHAGIPIDAAVVEQLRGVVAQVMPEALVTKNKPSLTMG